MADQQTTASHSIARLVQGTKETTELIEEADEIANEIEEQEIKHADILDDYHPTLFPTELPNLTVPATTVNNNMHIDQGNHEKNVAMNIRIDLSKIPKFTINYHRLVYALMKAFKTFDDTISITNMNETQSNIYELEQLRYFNDDPEDQLIESPTIVTNNRNKKTFLAKIPFSSMHQFYELLKNVPLEKWLKDNHIRLEHNPINTLTLTNVGFLTDCHPRDIIINDQVTRISSRFTNNDIKYHATRFQLRMGQASCPVILIQCEPNAKDELISMFSNHPEMNCSKFISWIDWQTLGRGYKIDIIETQNIYHKQYGTIIVTGFNDKNDTTIKEGIPFEKISIRDKEIDKMNVSTYIQFKYKTASDIPLIEF